MDKQTASNSLFGDDISIEVAVPEMPKTEPWTKLERLNKEKELVGLYLSAHPLDDYYLILQHVCSTRLAELSDKERLANRDLTVGGIVVDVKERLTQKGQPMGIAKLEDYSGSAEFAFYTNDWMQWKNYIQTGYSLFIKLRVTPRDWGKEKYQLRVTAISHLADIKETAIEKFTVATNIDDLDTELIAVLSAYADANPGKTELYFSIRDNKEGQVLVMQSKAKRINVKRELINYLSERANVDYKIN